MIRLSTITEQLNDALNEALNSSDLNTEKDKYEFCIKADTQDFKQPKVRRIVGDDGITRQVCTTYIMGIMEQADSTLGNTACGKLNASLNTRLEIIIPVLPGRDANGNIEIVQKVRDIIDGYFQINRFGTIEDDDITYTYGAQYSSAVSGIRSSTVELYDTFSFESYINYVVIQAGCNSRSFVLSIDNHLVDYDQMGMRRVSDQESNIPNNTQNGASGTTTSGTVLSLSVSFPTMLDSVNSLANGYLTDGGSNEAHLVTLTMPKYGGTTETKNYLMVFQDVSISAKTVYNAATSITMSQVLTANNIVTYSAAAQEAISHGTV